MDFDPAAEFLSREREVLGDDLENEIVNNNDEITSDPAVSDDFEMINDEIENSVAENEESFIGMEIPSTPIVQNELPEKIKIWQENHALLLLQKDKDEQESIERLREEGKQELSKWLENNKNNLEKIKENNRVNETNNLNGDDDGVVNDSEVWKSIYELCEFSQQKNKNGQLGHDTTRMKSIYLQLKQNPPNKSN